MIKKALAEKTTALTDLFKKALHKDKLEVKVEKLKNASVVYGNLF